MIQPPPLSLSLTPILIGRESDKDDPFKDIRVCGPTSLSELISPFAYVFSLSSPLGERMWKMVEREGTEKESREKECRGLTATAGRKQTAVWPLRSALMVSESLANT